MRIPSLMVAAMLVFSLSGCGGILYPLDTGNERVKEDTYISKIKPYQTRKHEVRTLLGNPQNITKSSSGDEVWTYCYMTFWMNSYSGQTVAIVFDRNGVVKEYKYTRNKS